MAATADANKRVIVCIGRQWSWKKLYSNSLAQQRESIFGVFA